LATPPCPVSDRSRLPMGCWGFDAKNCRASVGLGALALKQERLNSQDVSSGYKRLWEILVVLADKRQACAPSRAAMGTARLVNSASLLTQSVAWVSGVGCSLGRTRSARRSGTTGASSTVSAVGGGTGRRLRIRRADVARRRLGRAPRRREACQVPWPKNGSISAPTASRYADHADSDPLEEAAFRIAAPTPAAAVDVLVAPAAAVTASKVFWTTRADARVIAGAKHATRRCCPRGEPIVVMIHSVRVVVRFEALDSGPESSLATDAGATQQCLAHAHDLGDLGQAEPFELRCDEHRASLDRHLAGTRREAATRVVARDRIGAGWVSHLQQELRAHFLAAACGPTGRGGDPVRGLNRNARSLPGRMSSRRRAATQHHLLQASSRPPPKPSRHQDRQTAPSSRRPRMQAVRRRPAGHRAGEPQRESSLSYGRSPLYAVSGPIGSEKLDARPELERGADPGRLVDAG